MAEKETVLRGDRVIEEKSTQGRSWKDTTVSGINKGISKSKLRRRGGQNSTNSILLKHVEFHYG